MSGSQNDFEYHIGYVKQMKWDNQQIYIHKYRLEIKGHIVKSQISKNVAKKCATNSSKTVIPMNFKLGG